MIDAMYFLRCDSCGARSPDLKTKSEVRARWKPNGWDNIAGKDYCPGCVHAA